MESQGDDFEMLAASLRADARDMSTFVEALASKLEGALPQATKVDRKGGGLFSKDKRVRRIVVALPDAQYELGIDGTRVEPMRAKAVRGIVLKREILPLDEWIDGLSLDIAVLAARSEEARLVLERLLEA